MCVLCMNEVYIPYCSDLTFGVSAWGNVGENFKWILSGAHACVCVAGESPHELLMEFLALKKYILHKH